jgi:hypothetical protein
MTFEDEQDEELTVVTGQAIEIAPDDAVVDETRDQGYRNYLLLPALFLTVALFGGMRFGAGNGEFLFVRPALICLFFAAILMVLFFRARLVAIDQLFSEQTTGLEFAANASVLITLYAASVQVFNSLLPEAGLPFWVVGFCFLWTLWNNLFAGFDAARLLQSLGGLFVLAFIIKYMVLLNLSVEQSTGWWQFLSSGNITRETFSYLLSIPAYSGGTGYLQFFAIAVYLVGLFFLPPRLGANK